MKYNYLIINKKTTKYYLFILLLLLSCCFFIFKRNSIHTISGDITHKNIFNVFNTITIDDNMSFLDLKIIISPSKPTKSINTGYYLLRKEDSTRIKYVYPVMRIFEDIPEYNEVYWKTQLKAVINDKMIVINTCENKSKILTFPQKNNKNNVMDKGEYIIIPIIIENKKYYINENISYCKNIKNNFPNKKICFLLHFKNKNEKILDYWDFFKEIAESSQGRFEIFIH